MYVGVFIKNPISQMLKVKSDRPIIFADENGNIMETMNIGKGAKNIMNLKNQNELEIINVSNSEEKMLKFSEGMKKSLSRFGSVYEEGDGFFIIDSKSEDISIENIEKEMEMESIICISDNIKIAKAICPIVEKSMVINEKEFKEGNISEIDSKEDLRERIEFALYDEDEILDSLSGKMMDMEGENKKERIGGMIDSLVKDENMMYPLSCDIYLLIMKEGAQFIKKMTLKQDGREGIVEKISKAGKSAEKMGIFIYSSKSGKDRLTKFFGIG
ncbi:MAG: hypothetical protein NTY68_05040 [Candidatus Micrarchaeota archaeon]|nr:hypothetical protein [Candidatus Micrarchaeota archaeon]